MSLSVVHGKFDGVPRLQVERLISMQQPLHPILPSRDIIQRFDGIAKDSTVNHDPFLRLGAHSIDTVDKTRISVISNLKSRLLCAIFRQQKQDAPFHQFPISLLWIIDYKPQFAGRKQSGGERKS